MITTMVRKVITKLSVTRLSVLLWLLLLSQGFLGASLHVREWQATKPSLPQEAPQKDLAALKKELSETEAKKGKDHPDLIPLLTDIAKAYRDQGGYIPAQPFARRALEIATKVRGKDAIETAGALDFLGTLYRLQGDNKSALENYERAEPIVKKKLGPDHPAYAMMLNNLATVYIAIGKNAEAASALEKAMAVVSEAFGPASAEVTAIQITLAELCLRTGKYAIADQLLVYALAIRSEGLELPVQAGQTTAQEVLLQIAPVRNLLGRLYTVVGLYDKAEPLLGDALKAYETALGGEHPLLEGVLVNLAALSEATGETAKVAGYQKRAEQIHEKNIGFSHAAELPRLKPLVAALPSRNGPRPYSDARVGDWVGYEKDGVIYMKDEIIRKTSIVAITLTYLWYEKDKAWSPFGLERMVDLAADFKELYGVSENDLKPGKVRMKGIEVKCLTAVVNDEGKRCKIYVAPDTVPVGGVIKLVCDGKVILQAAEYHRAK
jgi:tetratricopeptide (TPR) repeat protein